MLLYHTFPLLHPNEIIKLFFLWSIIPTHPIINLSFLKQCFALFFFFFIMITSVFRHLLKFFIPIFITPQHHGISSKFFFFSNLPRLSSTFTFKIHYLWAKFYLCHVRIVPLPLYFHTFILSLLVPGIYINKWTSNNVFIPTYWKVLIYLFLLNNK